MPVREWTWKQIALMEWLSLPGDDLMGKGKGLRQPKTLTALAEKLGVHRDTLYEWQDLPGWNDALTVVAERTFKGLKPRFLTNLAASLLKPNPNDRLVQANVRYVEPTIQEHEASGLWDRILPEATAAANQEGTERIASEELRALPPAEREVILNFMSRVKSREGETVLTERESFQVRRMTTEVEDKLEAELLEEEEELKTLELGVVNRPLPDKSFHEVSPDRRVIILATNQQPRPALPSVVNTHTNKWKPQPKRRRKQ